ncbi:SOS response-associated peptidase [Viridibacterium curvum]|uniref:Abasic site processing protein n=1 Tax=Viridibacterium curvum TaxID=1101404 RepID=A0ABP9R755_9RHOO
MCSNYKAPGPLGLVAFAETHIDAFPSYRTDVWPGYAAPFLSNADGGLWQVGSFGLMPHWAKPDLFRSTYNARSETVAEKPSYRSAWRQRQLCIIPAEHFCEPNYESGKAVRWRIQRADGKPFGIAGLWEHRFADEGPARWSFTMLTINADQHPLMKRFHKPDDEKRSIVVLSPDDYPDWLNARTDAEARSLLQPFDAQDFVAMPDVD